MFPESIRQKRQRNRPRPIFDPALPITAWRRQIVEAVQQHQVLILSGETGSGKTTQIPKMCLEAGRGIRGKIACTQPRRIAAMTVAARIAEELGGQVGEAVGCKVRFHEKDHRNSFVKIMTDGMLLAEIQSDPRLEQYDTLIVDEAHERSLNIDVILGMLRRLVEIRRDLKVIITSATLDTQKFSQAFGGAPVIEVSGRLYPVDIRYRPPAEGEEGLTLPEKVHQALGEIIQDTRQGDILVFLPTEQDIRETIALASRAWGDRLQILPLFARLPPSEQRRVFQSGGRRKLVAATNVAETSLTIGGIRYVVDSGLARISRYQAATGTQGLPVDKISKSSAHQRAGRCGRVAEGICVRLYSQEDFESRELYTPPEISRTNLAEVLLRMISLNIQDIEKFPFVDPPPSGGIRDGLRTLKELHALESSSPGKPRLTAEGKFMARLPLDPRLARVLLQAAEEGCLGDVIPIAAALTLPDPRERPPGKEGSAAQAHAAFKDDDSDFFSWLNLWDRFRGAPRRGSFSSRLKKFCQEHYLSFRRMKEWMDIHKQLTLIMEENGFHLRRLPPGPSRDKRGRFTPRYTAVHRALLSGYLSHIARKKEKGPYEATRGREAGIHPGSFLPRKGGPPWLVAVEMVRTSRLFMRSAAAIDPLWLVDLGAHLLSLSWKEPRWSRKGGNVTAVQQARLYGFLVSDGKTVPYGESHPQEAREIFIRSALVEGDLINPTAHPFLEANRALLARLEQMQNKLRRRDLVAGEEALAAFYHENLPLIYDLGGLNQYLKKEGDAALLLQEEDLLTRRPLPEELNPFPEEAAMEGGPWRISYLFDPEKPEDGATLEVPLEGIGALTPEKTDWLVPGFLKEKIEFLLKGLPKTYRKQLIPLGETTQEAAANMQREGRDLLSALAEWLYRERRLAVPAEAWPREELPPHLVLRYSVKDSRGKEIAASRNPAELILKEGPAPSGRGREALKKKWELTGLTQWPREDIPRELPLPGGGKVWTALTVEKEEAALRLFDTPQDLSRRHREGQVRLAERHWAREIKNFQKTLGFSLQAQGVFLSFGGKDAVQKALWQRVLHTLFAQEDIRSRASWESLLAQGGGRLYPLAQEYRDAAQGVLEAYSQTNKALEKARGTAYRREFAQARLGELGQLVPPSFLQEYPPSRWRELPRYLKGLAARTQKGLADPGKDQKTAGRFQPLWLQWQEQAQNLSPLASEKKKEALEEARWFLEELRLVLFTPGVVRTPGKISEKRAAALLEELKHLI